MKSFEFGRKGPDGIKGEGATGLDELKYVPRNGDDSIADMTAQAEEINRLLESIEIPDEEGGVGNTENMENNEDIKKDELDEINTQELDKSIEELKEKIGEIFG